MSESYPANRQETGKHHGDEIILSHYSGGQLRSQEYRQDGKLHREDGPAVVIYRRSGAILEEQWRRDDQLHRADGPAVIFYRSNETVAEEQWYLNNRLCREDGPAETHYHPNGKIRLEIHYRRPAEESEPTVAGEQLNRYQKLKLWFFGGHNL